VGGLEQWNAIVVAGFIHSTRCLSCLSIDEPARAVLVVRVGVGHPQPMKRASLAADLPAVLVGSTVGVP
jgi:hypothetical protein